MNIETKNATITSTMLGTEDHGIMTSMIGVEGDGWGCGFGGFCFDRYDKNLKRRIGHAYGVEYLTRVLDVIGVQRWEDLKGKHCRVKSEGLGGRIVSIGNIVKDKWFTPSEDLKHLLD